MALLFVAFLGGSARARELGFSFSAARSRAGPRGAGQVRSALSGVSWRAWRAVVWVSHLGAVCLQPTPQF